MESTSGPSFFRASLHNKPTIGAVARSFSRQTTAIFRHVSQRFVCGFVLLWMTTAIWAQNEEAPAADVTQMSTGELEKQASFLVGTQKYVEAIPLLSELLTRLGESKEPQVQSKVENFRYFLGLGNVFNSDWQEAATRSKHS